MLSSFLRRAVRQAIRRSGRKIHRVPINAVTGTDLEEDLRLVVGRDQPVCFDIGANEGQTIRLLQRAFTEPMIYAFEPAETTFRKLKSQRFCRKVSFHPLALGSESSRREFINYRKSVLSSLLPLDESPENRFRGTEIASRQMVEVQTVDGFVAEHKIDHIDVLKIDTQGSDLAVLQGSFETIARNAIGHVLVELNFVPMYAGQAAASDISSFLTGHGFALIDFYQKERERHTLAWCTALFGRRNRSV
jgi:FkbM family methyltransferase